MRLRPGLVVREESFGGLVFDVRHIGVWVINDSATAALLLCDGVHDRAAIAREVGELYGSSLAREEADAFLASMAKEGIVLED